MKRMTYRDSGVDIVKADKLVDFITKTAKKTYSPGVLAGIGGFSAAYSIPKGYKNPVLVSCTDGVGTKLKIAFALGKHDTIGIDLVAMSVNDLITCGAKPLFFLDYFATGKLDSGQSRKVLEGIIEGCRISDCALIGGETAEMPDFYQPGEYDLSGFAVGIVERNKIMDGRKIKPGDTVIGLASSGPHSNGFSLVRKLIAPKEWKKFAKALLEPTRIYAGVIAELIKKFEIKGIAHITGGGLLENIPRILPVGTAISIKKGTWPVHEIFNLLQKRGNISEQEIYRTFNMGIGMALVVSAGQADRILRFANNYGEAYIIGRVVKGKQEVYIKNNYEL
jgi:phosphoribosylformylglycinamidine cyclo-ligase